MTSSAPLLSFIGNAEPFRPTKGKGREGQAPPLQNGATLFFSVGRGLAPAAVPLPFVGRGALAPPSFVWAHCFSHG